MRKSKNMFTPYTKQFQIELGSAKKAEKWVKEALEEDFGEVIYADDKEIHYDLLIRVGGQKVEVKYDKMSRKTGMVAIELSSYGKYKGILRSNSDFYAIICYDKDWSEIINGIKKRGMWICVLIDKEYLRELVITKPYKKVFGGDNKMTEMKLVPVKDIREANTRIYPITNI